jgi:hypothetical protein
MCVDPIHCGGFCPECRPDLGERFHLLRTLREFRGAIAWGNHLARKRGLPLTRSRVRGNVHRLKNRRLKKRVSRFDQEGRVYFMRNRGDHRWATAYGTAALSVPVEVTL